MGNRVPLEQFAEGLPTTPFSAHGEIYFLRVFLSQLASARPGITVEAVDSEPGQFIIEFPDSAKQECPLMLTIEGSDCTLLPFNPAEA